MSSSAITAESGGSPTVAAARATAPSANRSRGQIGSRPDKRSFSIRSIFTLFSPYPTKSQRSHSSMPGTVYDIMFRTAAETLRTIAADPKHLGAEIGFFSVLHTWGQNLLHHPHLHCVVPGGGLSPRWQPLDRVPARLLLPVAVLSRLFRRLFLSALQKSFDTGELQFFSSLEPLRDPAAFQRYLNDVGRINWVIYAKPPFGSAE
ncbi:hypothetical protein ACVWW1_008706 [Bradyrhizobium sp. JR3.5]